MDRPATTSLKCMSNTGTLLAIHKDAFLTIIKKDADLWNHFIEMTSERDGITLDKLKLMKITNSKLMTPIAETIDRNEQDAQTRKTLL